MRTFIAIELSEEIRDTLAQIQSHLKYSGSDVKWVEKDNIHLTLKFLGEIDEEKCKEVKSALDKIAVGTKPFDISLKDIGEFPKIDHPKVLWAGLDKGAKESTGLAADIDEAMSRIGFDKETRPFAAHRIRSSKNREALKTKITDYQLPITDYETVSSIILFQSKLTPHGPIYTKLHESKFS